jgi:hypothetical protein
MVVFAVGQRGVGDRRRNERRIKVLSSAKFLAIRNPDELARLVSWGLARRACGREFPPAFAGHGSRGVRRREHPSALSRIVHGRAQDRFRIVVERGGSVSGKTAFVDHDRAAAEDREFRQGAWRATNAMLVAQIVARLFPTEAPRSMRSVFKGHRSLIKCCRRSERHREAKVGYR